MAGTPSARSGTETSSGDTRLIDLGEAIADENSRAKPAPWKYALALGLPILLAIGLIALLAGRGGDDPDFTVSDSTELAVDLDTSDEAELAREPAADDEVSDDDATAILSDAESENENVDGGVDEDRDEETGDDSDPNAEAGDGVEVDGTTGEAADIDTDDEPNISPTEAPEPTLEPEATETSEPATASGSANNSDDDDDDTAAGDDDNPFSVGGSTQLGDDDAAGSNDADDDGTEADPTAVPTATAEPTSGSTNDPEPTTAPTATPTTAPTTAAGTSGGTTPGSGDATAGDLRTFADLDALAELYPGIAPDAPDYDAYNKVTDDTGALSMWVPTAFTFVNGEPDQDGAQLSAGAEEGLSLEVSGVALRLHTDGNIDEILAENGPAFIADCTVLTNSYELPADLEYQGLLYAEELSGDDGVGGAYIIYESCLFGAEPTSIVEVALQNDNDDVALIRMQIASMADLGALDTILRSLDF